MIKRAAVALILVALLAAAAHAESGPDAAELYRKAKSPGLDRGERIRLLEESVTKEPSYPAYYELGRAYNEASDPGRAVDAFVRAAGCSWDTGQKAKALALVGRLYAAQDDRRGAIPYFKQSLKERYDAKVAQELMALQKQAGDTVAAAEITRSLAREGRLRSIGVAPSIDLRIGFEFDSHRLTAQGRAQLQELAKAMQSDDFAGKSFSLKGHTDRRGDDGYNDRLSRQRAEAVRDFLVSAGGIERRRLAPSGKGKREPIFLEESEEAHSMNRRVEVTVLGE